MLAPVIDGQRRSLVEVLCLTVIVMDAAEGSAPSPRRALAAEDTVGTQPAIVRFTFETSKFVDGNALHLRVQGAE